MIYESANAHPSQKGMGTTIDCMLIEKDKISIAHIGDSRVYLYRNGTLRQLTQDHSLVAEQVRQGVLKKDEAEKSHLKNILTRALGVDQTVEVDMIELESQENDLILSCTD